MRTLSHDSAGNCKLVEQINDELIEHEIKGPPPPLTLERSKTAHYEELLC